MSPLPTYGDGVQPTNRPSARERAFTIVELIVVMLIIAVITGFAVNSMISSRGSGGRVELRAAASRYADAIERYQTDHGRKVPDLASADWPWARVNYGPIKRLQIGATVVRPYLKGDPPDVMNRTGPTGARWVRGTAPRAKGGTLVYVRNNAYSFRIDAFWDGKPVCSAGDIAVGSNVNRCSGA